VSWNRGNEKWEAYIHISDKKEFLGYYIEEEEAARRYDLAALHRRGRDTKINFKLADYLDAAGELVQEEAAARAFDRAAIHCRDLRPHCSSLEWLVKELNFPLSDYTNVGGGVVDDPRLTSVMAKVDKAVAANEIVSWRTF
jgi:hypothetical protein